MSRIREAIARYEAWSEFVDFIAETADDDEFDAACDHALNAMFDVVNMPVESHADALEKLAFMVGPSLTELPVFMLMQEVAWLQ